MGGGNVHAKVGHEPYFCTSLLFCGNETHTNNLAAFALSAIVKIRPQAQVTYGNERFPGSSFFWLLTHLSIYKTCSASPNKKPHPNRTLFFCIIASSVHLDFGINTEAK